MRDRTAVPIPNPQWTIIGAPNPEGDGDVPDFDRITVHTVDGLDDDAVLFVSGTREMVYDADTRTIRLETLEEWAARCCVLVKGIGKVTEAGDAPTPQQQG
jgi:hypothetical protein